MNSCSSFEILSSQGTSDLLSQPQLDSSRPFRLPFTQSAAALVRDLSSNLLSTGLPQADKLLGGGLRQRHILEISGPPGTIKEDLAARIVKGALQNQAFIGNILFVDMQNMTVPATLLKILGLQDGDPAANRIQYHRVHTLPQLMIFMYTLLSYLETNKTTLLVLNSLSFPFQTSPELSPATRTSLLGRIKPILARACAIFGVTIVVTTQLTTKLVSQDGSTANFDMGGSARGYMLPSLGNTWLPLNKTQRLLIVPQSRISGVLRLLSSPALPRDAVKDGVAGEERYQL